MGCDNRFCKVKVKDVAILRNRRGSSKTTRVEEYHGWEAAQKSPLQGSASPGLGKRMRGVKVDAVEKRKRSNEMGGEILLIKFKQEAETHGRFGSDGRRRGCCCSRAV